MICQNCGTNNKPGARFCKRCGSSISTSKKRSTKSRSSTRSINFIPIIVVLCVIGVLVGGFFALRAFGIFSPTINLDKYVTIEATGYNGYGEAKASIDWDAIDMKYGSKVKYTSKMQNASSGMVGVLTGSMSPVQALSTGVDVFIDKAEGLSNGDVINYTWSIPNDTEEYFNCKLQYSDGSYTVSGLQEITKFDAFGNVQVEYTGKAPNGSIRLSYDGEELSPYDFECDKTSGLSNGDVITVSISNSAVQKCIREYGKAPAETEKQLTVDGLQGYATSFSDLDQDTLDAMSAQASDEFNALVTRWDNPNSLQSFEYVGNYFLTAKSDGVYGAQNMLYLVFKATVHNYVDNPDGQVYDGDNDVYWYIKWSNIMTKPDGTADVDITRYETPYDTFDLDTGVEGDYWFSVGTKKLTYKGYATLEDLYSKNITANANNYNHEDNI